MIKILSCISNTNKTQKKLKDLFKKYIKSLTFSYDEINSTIKYEEYCFNGIPIPHNIILKNISDSSIDISWNIDNIKNNKIKYAIEMRKENGKFNKVYEGNKNNCSLNNLMINTNYEFRICCYNNDFISEWTQIQKFKTLGLDSVILKECNKKDESIKKLSEWGKFK